MLRSLFAGVSGLRNQQTRMDVIGNNVANVNTVAFKAGRVTMKEGFAQLLQGASRPPGDQGGINPIQIGLGSQIGSIDQLYTQGNLETTGQATDLAIQGDSMFVVRKANQSFYTRSGNFQLDADGRLVSPTNGFVVQGQLFENGAPRDGIEDIRLPFGQKVSAHATTGVTLGGNVNAAAPEVPPGFSIFSQADRAAHTASWTETSITAFDSLGTQHDVKVQLWKTAANEWSYRLDPSSPTVALPVTVAQTPATPATSATSGTATPGSGTGAATYTAVANGTQNASANGTYTLRSSGGTLTLQRGGVTVGTPITQSTLAAGGTANFGNGITLTLGGSYDNTAAALDGLTFTVAGAAAAAPALPPGNGFSIPSVPAGALVTVAGATTASGLAIDAKYITDDGNGGYVIDPSINLAPGDTIDIKYSLLPAPPAGASATAPDTWGGVNGGKLTFDQQGNLDPTRSDLPVLAFSVPGAEDVRVKVDLGSGETGFTQYATSNSAVLRDQDGFTAGTLQNFSVDRGGLITGFFTNGTTTPLGRIVLADFNNPAGLLRSGDNMYQESANSGGPVMGFALEGSQSQITAGALEMSNVDLAQEFTNMIIAQRGFQANGKVITTSDEMLQELMQIKR